MSACVVCRPAAAQIFVLIVAMSGLACSGGRTPATPVSVPELDRQQVFSFDRSDWQKGAEALVRRNGEPSFRVSWAEHEVWAYAVRGFSPKGQVPAALLRIIFADDVLADWYFVNPATQEQLAINETVQQARRAVGGPWGACFGKPPQMVDLEKGLRRQESTVAQVESLLGPFTINDKLSAALQASGMHMSSTLFRRRTRSSAGRTIWELFVDRPSAAFIPAWYKIFWVGDGKILASYDEGDFGDFGANAGCL